MPKVRSVQFQGPTEILNMSHLSQVSSGQVTIEDMPKSRCVVIRSLDERMKDFAVIPYENVRAIRYTDA